MYDKNYAFRLGKAIYNLQQSEYCRKLKQKNLASPIAASYTMEAKSNRGLNRCGKVRVRGCIPKRPLMQIRAKYAATLQDNPRLV
jgi:hypothetical protein